MSAAPEGETAAIHTRVPAPALIQRFIAVTPVGTRNHGREASGRLVQKSHTIQSLAPGIGRISVAPTLTFPPRNDHCGTGNPVWRATLSVQHTEAPMNTSYVPNLAGSSLALAVALAASGASAQTVITRTITAEPVETTVTQTPT